MRMWCCVYPLHACSWGYDWSNGVHSKKELQTASAFAAATRRRRRSVAAMRRACAELASTSAPRRARWALDAARAMVEGMMRARGVHGGAREVAIERWSSDLMEVRRRASCVVARASVRDVFSVPSGHACVGRAWGVARWVETRARGCIFWNAECGLVLAIFTEETDRVLMCDCAHRMMRS